MRNDETDIGFRLQDYLDTDVGNCRIVVLSDASIDYLLSTSRFGSFSPARWTFNGLGIEFGSQAWQLKESFVNETEGALIMACNDVNDITAQLARIADAIESIDARQGNHLTWEEFIEDLETAFGIGSVAALLAEKTLGLFPNFRFRYDGTAILAQAAMSLVETHTRWTPLNRNLLAMNTSLGIIAGVTAFEKPLAIIRTLLLGVSTAVQWTDFLIDGFQQMWQNFLFILGLWSGDNEEIPNPDEDASMHPVINVINSQTIANIINACCVGLPDLPPITVGNEIPATDQSNSVSPTVPPDDNGQITWGGATSSGTKCQTANYITKAVRDLFSGLASQLPDTGISAAAVMAAVATIAASAAFVPVIALPGLIAVAAIVAGISLSQSVQTFLSQIASAITSRYDDIVCAMADAPSVGTGRDAVKAILTEELLPSQVDAAMLAFGATALTALFYDNPNIDPSSESDDCGDCTPSECAASFAISLGSGPTPPNIAGTWHSQQNPAQTGKQYLQVTSIDPPISLRFFNLTNHVPQDPDDFRIWDSSLTLIYNSATPPSSATLFSDVKQFIFVGKHPNVFTVETDCE